MLNIINLCCFLSDSVSSQDSFNLPVADYTPPSSPHIDKHYTEDFPAPPPEISNVQYTQSTSGGITPPPDVTRKTSDTKAPTRVAHVQSLRIADENTEASGEHRDSILTLLVL